MSPIEGGNLGKPVCGSVWFGIVPTSHASYYQKGEISLAVQNLAKHARKKTHGVRPVRVERSAVSSTAEVLHEGTTLSWGCLLITGFGMLSVHSSSTRRATGRRRP